MQPSAANFCIMQKHFCQHPEVLDGTKKVGKISNVNLKIGKPSDVSKSLEKNFDVGNRKS